MFSTTFDAGNLHVRFDEGRGAHSRFLSYSTGSFRVPTRKAADLVKHEVCATCLVTLSACDTANGKLEGEEGIDGLAEAFLLAGPRVWSERCGMLKIPRRKH